MKIRKIAPRSDWTLSIVAEDGRTGLCSVKPYLQSEIVKPLQNPHEFLKVYNGGYFIEWDCGADLSADTIEAGWQVIEDGVEEVTV